MKIKARLSGSQRTIDIICNNGRWYASVCFDVETKQLLRESGIKPFAFDLWLETYSTGFNGEERIAV